MTAMESMTSAPVAATKAVTTAAKTAAVTTTTTTHQDQRTARCTQLLGVAGIARQRGQ